MNLERARQLSRGALRNLERNTQRINDLNVYPVPDGDTGTNLAATVRGIVKQLDVSNATGPRDVADELKRAALYEAKGNSGVIFSQIVRGFAEVLGERDPMDSAMVVRAFRSASDAAYRAVQRPVEGTMLTIIREMAEELEQSDRTLPKAELLARAVARGEDALKRTPDLLPVLKEAGVVDAGGAGLVEIMRGLYAALAGEELPVPPAAGEDLGVEAIHQGLSEYRYCTMFILEGEGLDADAVEGELERLGDSLLVVGDPSALKVHVHTDDPGAVLSVAMRTGGTLEGVEIANMHRQSAEREERLAGALERLPTLRTGLVAVVAGHGNRRLFESEGATRVIEGGQTMNPSIGDIVAAVEATPAEEVIVLPNNDNVLLAAEQAVTIASKPARVVPTTTMQAGIEAVIVYDPERTADENEQAMKGAIEDLVTGEVTRASRDVDLDGIDVREGAWLGLAEGRAVACSEDLDAVVDAVVARLLEDGRETLTILAGEGAPDLAALGERIRTRYPHAAIDPQDGGQPHYPLLLAAV